ncbi:hypothetical protein F4V57_04945 [Acinetobacter qingfengensis]|uniref:4-aminobutyrate aminotransferase n=1 Tax=Acinetobacter qingfengensis TaxID=1262585 RepID=A0A1E7RCR5_9GAMM|nr:DUF5682 family protein [Acinetobacter qingfengensis]KAA8734319.1 hypothetical protein F4V57_04945 [Acinetobacter qingfengensis]OEY97083.1 hypothetical protein BJI46_10695 [Acinetobacter qingfengensis]
MDVFSTVCWPERLTEALQKQQQLMQQNIFFAPIRHHSPACAYTLKYYIQDLQPTHILIEAPYSFQPLLTDLLSEHTVPPIAIFAQAHMPNNRKSEDCEDTANLLHSAYFPFCDYSPEWIALHEGHNLEAKLQFIDQSWAEQCHQQMSLNQNSTQQNNLMQERYLAHSQFIQQLAQRLHCRNHDELWDHLFELQTPEQLHQAQDFFKHVFGWCALARLDYEQEVLLREGSLHREYCMLQHIQPLMGQDHKILVVTGGFHTLALIEQLTDQTPHKYLIDSGAVKWSEQNWLIRYSFDRLDALNGYASGMPSPAYYQSLWQNLNQMTGNPLSKQEHPSENTTQHCLDYLSRLCRELADKQALEVTPYIALKHTSELALGLAQLRGHYRPSRYDILDALQTALIKGEMDDGQHYLLKCIHDYVSGQQLGQVAKTQRSPALLQNTYQLAQNFRFKLDDTLNKQRKLDIYRKPLHQKISQFLHLLSYINVGFAECLSGPDFVHGVSMSLLFEEWRYAWTPSVEARLIELAEQGDQLKIIASRQLLQTQQQLQKQGLGQSADHTAKLFAQACQLGLNQQLALFSQQLNQYLHQDQNLGSLINATEQLFYLWHGKTLLQLPEQLLKENIILALQQACFALDQIYDEHEEKIEKNLKNLKTLHTLLHNSRQQFNIDNPLELFYQNIDVSRLQHIQLAKLFGALQCLLYLDGHLSSSALQQSIVQAFGSGSHPESAIQYLQGILFIAPEIFVQSDIAIKTLHQLIGKWQDEEFLRLLPDLRYIFSQLSPQQSQCISEKISQYTGLQNDLVLDQVYGHISEQEMLLGAALNQQLKTMLEKNQLQEWINTSIQTGESS